MSHNNPPVRNAVIAVLKARGPMTVREIAEELDWPVSRVHAVVANGRRLHPEKLFRAVSYRPVKEGKGKDTSVYAAMPGKDAKRQPIDKEARARERLARYRQRHRAAINARLRAKRAAKRKQPTAINPWMQLAPKELRSAMTMAANDNRLHYPDGRVEVLP